MRKYLDSAGVKFLWEKIVRTFVRKDGNKVLSDNNYSNEDKEKLAVAATKDELQSLKEDLSRIYSYKGSVETVADLDDIENPENGDIYDVAENGKGYVWNATKEKWEEVSSMLQVNALSDEDLTTIINEHSA